MAKQKKKRKNRSTRIANAHPICLTEPLETLDPSDNYKGTEFEGLDALQRQLKRFNIKCTKQDESVSKFFK